MRKTMSDVTDLLKVASENGCAKQIRNSMLLTAISPLAANRSRANSKSSSTVADNERKQSVAWQEAKETFTPPAMELAADLVSYNA